MIVNVIFKFMTVTEFLQTRDWWDVNNNGLILACIINKKEFLLYFKELGYFSIEGMNILVEQLTDQQFGLSVYNI